LRKFASDALVIFEIETLKARAWWPFYVLSIVMFPIGTLYFAKALIPPGAEDLVGTRLMTGSLVFALGLMTVNNLAQIMLWERFNQTLKLVITSPVHPLSYACGIISFALVQGMITAVVVLSFAPVVNIHIELSWWLIPVLMLTSLSLTGFGVIIATWSPTQEMGNILANMVGIMVTLLSPVYFPIERLPHWLRWREN
jgi:ABC-2 type transport system permease protein